MRSIFAVLTIACAIGPALGQERAASFDQQTSVTLATDRVWRGLSQTKGGPAAMGEVKWNHRAGPFVGLWASNYAFNSRGDSGVATLPFAGFNRSLGQVNIDAGYLYRHFSASDHDHSEATLSVGYRFAGLSARVGTFYSWNHYLGSDSFYSYLDTRIPLGTIGKTPIVLSTHAGLADLPGGDSDYGDVQLSLAAKTQWITCAVHLSHATNDGESQLEGAQHGGSRLVFSLSKLFE